MLGTGSTFRDEHLGFSGFVIHLVMCVRYHDYSSITLPLEHVFHISNLQKLSFTYCRPDNVGLMFYKETFLSWLFLGMADTILTLVVPFRCL